MSWFLIALIPPLLYSVVNHIDKHLISTYFKGGGNGAVLIFSSLIGFAVFPLIFLFRPNVISIELSNAILLIVNGFLNTILLIPYFHALEKDEASVVVPMFQTIPVFSYILAYFFLSETLTTSQILASLLVIFGAILLSLDITEKKPKFKKEVFLLMLLSSFLYAVTSLIFKSVALHNDYWTTIFWEYIGLGIVGISLYIFVSRYRAQFLTTVKINKVPILSLNILNEIIYVFAILALRFATLLAPIALVWVVNGLQPLFVFAIGVLLTLVVPKFGSESLIKKHLIQKIIAIFIMLLGTIMLNFGI